MAVRLVTLQQAAEAAAASESTLRRMIARGELTRYSLGRVIRIDLDELLQLMRGAKA